MGAEARLRPLDRELGLVLRGPWRVDVGRGPSGARRPRMLVTSGALGSAAAHERRMNGSSTAQWMSTRRPLMNHFRVHSMSLAATEMRQQPWEAG